MPDMREVYDMVTKQTPPQADPLEQQHRRQRSAARKRRVGAYAAVAAVLIALAIASVAISRAVERNDVTPEGQGSSTPSDLTFTGTLPPGATPQKLAVVDLQGKQLSVVQNVPPQAFTPSLSADGSTIAFTDAPPEIGYNQVAIMRTDGSDAHFLPTPGIDVGLIAISPDATRVAFAGDAGNGNDIYVMNTDGSGLRRLTNDPATDQFPQWSPDGNTIVYDNAGAQEKPSDAQFSKTAEIFTVPADGSESPTRITHNAGYDAAPSFSPDGKSIADESFRGISIMNTDGSNPRSVSGSGGFSPRWSPDGTKLAFLSFSSRYQPSVQLGETYNPDAPLLQLGVVVVANGQVTKLRNVVTATNLNAPQWTDDGHIMMLRVPPMEPAR